MKEFAGNDRGVSKVIGVVLMTAIVIALAATMAAMATGFGGMLNDPAPQVAFDAEYHEDVENPEDFHPDLDSDTSEILEVTHYSGDRFDPTQVEYVISRDNEQLFRSTWADSVHGQSGVVGTVDTLYPSSIGSETLRNVRIQFIWTTEDGDQGQVIYEWKGPEYE